MNTIYKLFKDKESVNALPTDSVIGPKTWFYQKSTEEIKAMLKTLEDTADLLNDFQYRGNPKQRMLADEMSRNGGIGGIHKLMKTLYSEIRRRRINGE